MAVNWPSAALGKDLGATRQAEQFNTIMDQVFGADLDGRDRQADAARFTPRCGLTPPEPFYTGMPIYCCAVAFSRFSPGYGWAGRRSYQGSRLFVWC